MEFLSNYGLFLAKVITLLAAVIILVAFTVTLTSKEKEQKHKLRIKKLNKKYRKYSHMLHEVALDRKGFKAYKKEYKKKREKQEEAARRRLFVLNFHGDIRATGVTSLAEIISAILTTATHDDEVVARIESGGGMVHSYGLAAAQLKRIRDQKIPLTVTVDKVAASGGYMMACVANKILAAPFAIVGSIGVVAELPNFHKFLKKKNIDYEQVMAGEYKRTMSMFGENTSKDREKTQEDVDNIHIIFKQFVTENRPQVNIDEVATGEIWHGVQALQHNLVDELITSDDYLLTASEHADIFEVSITGKPPVMQRLTRNISILLQAFGQNDLHYRY